MAVVTSKKKKKQKKKRQKFCSGTVNLLLTSVSTSVFTKHVMSIRSKDWIYIVIMSYQIYRFYQLLNEM